MQTLERWRYIYVSGYEKITKHTVEDLCSLRFDTLNILKGLICYETTRCCIKHIILRDSQEARNLPREEKNSMTWNQIATAKSLQLCLTLCDPIDSSPPGSPVPGILQARTLEWIAISFSSAWKWKVKVKSLSRVRPSVTPWTSANQAPPSMGFSRQEYWSGVPFPSPKAD